VRLPLTSPQLQAVADVRSKFLKLIPMDEKDLELLIELTHKAAKKQWYDIAASLKDAREKLKKKLNDKWVDTILEQIKNE
jgi:hypothetical protein